MWKQFQMWIIKRWLLKSEVRIIEKDNGFTNIQIKHLKHGILVLHPMEEYNTSDREKNFYPHIGYKTKQI
jgi:hypothetical protein